LYARTFSVTPLSDRSGWLRWVDGVFPIFELVKQEQARRKEREDRARLNAASNPGAGAAGGKPKNMLQSAAAAMKASDLFAHKLAVHCARAGLPKHIARRDVPLGVLLNVFVEMEQESGAESVHLLSRELWLSSCSAGELYLKQLALTRSLSTMSVLGYILGLGDRHLGNIMISLARGDVLHIDWNVALERGLKLPIPEVIPFRLTGILINAGGLVMSQPQAHAGVFHATAMQTLHSVRSSQHVFSQLLSHTFVYHPLAEWQSLSAKPFLLLRKNADLRMRTMLLQQTTQQPPQLQQQQSQDGQTFEHRLVTSSAPPMREEKNKSVMAHRISSCKRPVASPTRISPFVVHFCLLFCVCVRVQACCVRREAHRTKVVRH
jgi:PI-3-kinase-related kinase SMG-1